MKFASDISNVIFEDEEAAREDAVANMTLEDYASHLELRFSYEDLLEWAFQHNFFEGHEDLIEEVQEEFFNDWYVEYEDEEDEEEEQDF